MNHFWFKRFVILLLCAAVAGLTFGHSAKVLIDTIASMFR